MKPLCFVIMPFGKKKDANDKWIDFDYVYSAFIKPVIEKAGLSPIRADEEMMGGIIHKPMYERLILCDYAIADLTAANANVFYELGIRYTAKPFTTFSIFETGTKIPFDLVDVRCFPYTLTDGKIENLETQISKLLAYLEGVKKQKLPDSPIYQLLEGIEFKHSLSHEKVEMLREQVKNENDIREKLTDVISSTVSKEEKIQAIQLLESAIGKKEDWVASLAVDFMLALRSVEGYEEMAKLIESLPAHLNKALTFREQYGFALNRAGQKDKAIQVLNSIVDENGPNSETLGILGRIYKDQFYAFKDTDKIKAKGFLNKAIDTYLMGFKADIRDYYPGVNAATLKYTRGDEDVEDFAKVVEYAVKTQLEKKEKVSQRRATSNFDDYWPYATLLELAVLQNNQDKAFDYLSDTLAIPNESWQRKTTANNLQIFLKYGDWVKEIIENLLKSN